MAEIGRGTVEVITGSFIGPCSEGGLAGNPRTGGETSGSLDRPTYDSRGKEVNEVRSGHGSGLEGGGAIGIGTATLIHAAQEGETVLTFDVTRSKHGFRNTCVPRIGTTTG